MSPTRARRASHATAAASRTRREPSETAARTVAISLVALYALVLGVVVFVGHPTPLYQVETDLVGEYIPAANDLLRGAFTAEHYTSKGFGYPLLLAAATPLAGGDGFLAARALNVIAAVLGAWLAYLLFAGVIGAWPALLVLVGMVVTPSYVQGAVEAGTDMPTFALSIAATLLILRVRSGVARHEARALLAAGVLAGYAIITRYNSAFLPLAALVLLVMGPRRVPRLARYLAGVAIPVVPWMIASLGVPEGVFGGQNTLNMAYEFYGQGQGQDAFWTANASRFHSLLDVARHDPQRFLGHLAANLGTRWLLHVQRLLVPPLGWAAAIGLVAGAWRRPGGAAIALHFALCYAILATVFFLPRFHIYLVPFYLSGAAWLAFALFRARSRAAAAPAWALPASLALGLVLTVPSFVSVGEEQRLLAKSPEEARVAGVALRALGPADAGVIARKPHVAYYARMRYVPFPDVGSYAELLDLARNADARYLYYSVTEAGARPRLMPLAVGDARLPGLEPVRAQRLGPSHYYALYHFTGERASEDSLEAAVVELWRQFAASRADDPNAQLGFAEELISAERYGEALEVLALARQLAPDWPVLPPVIARAESLARGR